MTTLRIVQFVDGRYAVQQKNGFLCHWRYCSTRDTYFRDTYDTVWYINNYALVDTPEKAEIVLDGFLARLRRIREEDQIPKISKIIKVVKV